jgi:hypothetical protein
MPVPVPLLLLGLGALGVKILGDRESTENCDRFTPIARGESQKKRNAFLSRHVGEANLAPGRVLFSNGQPVEAGTIQLLWKSDGPWGRDGCTDLKYGVRTQLLAEAPVTQNPINIDLGHMLGNDPWGSAHYDAQLILQNPKWQSGTGVGSHWYTHRLAHEIFWAPMESTVKTTSSIKRRSWIEAQVSIGDLHWATGKFQTSNDSSTLGVGPSPRSKGALKPVHPTAIYGAIRNPKNDKKTFSGYSSDVSWKLSGPDALILLRPKSKGRGLAISVYDDMHIDSTLLFYRHNSDVAFFGTKWLTQQKVNDTLVDNQFNQILSESMPDRPARPIDVLLWLVFNEAEEVAKIENREQPMPGSLDYLNMLGNRQQALWNQLTSNKPGWEEILNSLYYEIAAMMEHAGHDPFA